MIHRHLSRLFLICGLLTLLAGPAHAAPDNIELLAKGGAGGWLNVTRPLTVEDIQAHSVILLDFWTYGCINCIQITPDLDALEKTFGDKLLIIGVHSAKFTAEQGNDRITAAIQRFGLHHPVINDSDFAIWNAFNVKAWPTLILIDPQGEVINTYEGEGHRDAIAADITRTLQTAAPQAGDMTPISNLITPVKDAGLLWYPARLAYDVVGKQIYIADTGHNRIVSIDETGAVKNIIGMGQQGLADGDYAHAQFNHPHGITFLSASLYVADTDNHSLREINLATHTVKTVVGTGHQGTDRSVHDANGESASLASPWDVEPLADGKTLAIAVAGLHQLWGYNTVTKKASVIAGTGQEDIVDGPAMQAALAQPSALSRDGNTLYFTDAESSALRMLGPDGKVSTLIGTGLFDFGQVDGVYPDARMQHPQGLFAEGRRNRILIADTYNNALRIYNRQTKTLSTLVLPPNSLNEPGDIIVVGDTAYVADTNNHLIKKLDLMKGVISTIPVHMPTP